MKKIAVKGGRPLFGEIAVSGSKNAALPVIFATLATRGVSRIDRVPDITDVGVALELAAGFGALVMREGESVFIDTRNLYYNVPNPHLTSKIRASTYLLGSLLSAFGRCPLMNFGGCNFSNRPIDLHIKALGSFGASVLEGCLVIEKPEPAVIEFPKASVGATANALIMASSVNGKSIIRGHAIEPHILCLIDFLRSAGAEISVTDEEICVAGGELHGGSVRLIGDMIEAGSYLAAGVATEGCVTVRGCDREHMRSFADFLSFAGCSVTYGSDSITCERGEGALFTQVSAEPYPAFPTDLQPIAATVLATGAGGIIYDRVFPDRFGYLKELSRFGVGYVTGHGYSEILSSHIHSAESTAPDLRGGAACLICALAARGESSVYSPEMLLRGYENLENKLRQIGADIEFV